MSNIHVQLPSFNAGEVSSLMGSRFGVEKVASGCRKLRNLIIHPHGPAFRRPGMEFIGMAATNASASNLRSFQFSASTVAVLEFSEFGLRVWKDGALVTLLAPVMLPYSAAELADLQTCQVNDVVYLAHPNHEPRKLIRYADNDWRLQAIDWIAPALLDENPGDQALPDQYVQLSSTPVVPYMVVGPSTLTGFWTDPFGTASDHAVNVAFIGTPPTGWKRLIIEAQNLSAQWVLIYDHTWTTSLPVSYPFNAGGSFITNGNYRVRYHGEAWSNGGSPGQVRLANAVKPLPNTNGKLFNITGMAPAAPASVVVPSGNYKFSVVCSPTAPFASGTWAKLEMRTTIGSGPWAEIFHYDLSAPVVAEVTGNLPVQTEFRWINNAFGDFTGSSALDLYTISLTAPWQTSIALSNVTVGTGRTLTANRSLFKPGHVGSFWQLTHRRETAFVEIVSTSAAVAAVATLTLSSVAVAAATVTIGSRTYTWAASVTTVSGTVAIGASASASCSNLAAAINAGAGGGTVYGSATPPHADVTAVAVGSTVVITARTPGKGAHAIPVTDAMTNGSWDDVFLHGGIDANTSFTAAQTGEIRINGAWDVLTYGSWAATLFLERKNASGTWDFVRSWRANKDRNIAASGFTDGDETLRLRITSGTSSETSIAASPRFMLEATDARLNGLVKITAIGPLNANGQAVSATCDVIVPALSTSPTYVWTEGAWSEAQGFPCAVTMHQNRLWFAGTAQAPMRIWGSVSGDIENFRRTSLDDASVSWTPLAEELNPIQWMISQGADMVIGTGGDEWTLSGQGKAITPTNYDFQRQSRFGSSATAAIMANEVVVFVQRGGRKVRRVSQRSNNEPWSTSDMTVLAEHVALDGIKQLAFSSNPSSILWAVTTGGKLLGMTLEVEQNVFGWHVHETDGQVESVAVVYGTNADEIWLSVKRGAIRTIERLDPVVFARDFSNHQRMIFADSAVRYEGAPTSNITGLAHLNGRTVSILADGVARPSAVVSGGSVILTSPASVVVVGLPFASILQPCRFDLPTQKGTAQGMNWRVSRVGLYLHDSQGGEVAEHPDGTFVNLPYDSADLYSGDIDTAVESTVRFGADALVKTSGMLPFTVGAMVLKLDIYGD